MNFRKYIIEVIIISFCRVMGVEMVYLPVIYENNEQVPVHTPFKIDKNRQVKDIRLNKKGKIKYSFNRKFPVAYPDIVKLRYEDLIGGKFEFAEDEMFSIIRCKLTHS